MVELSSTRNIHLPKHGRELPREAEVGQPGPPYTALPYTHPGVPLPARSVPESRVAALAPDPGLSVVTTSSSGCFPKMASKHASKRLLAACSPFGSKRLRAAKCLPLWIVPKYERPWSDCCSSEMVSWNLHTQLGLLAHGQSGMTRKVSFWPEKPRMCVCGGKLTLNPVPPAGVPLLVCGDWVGSLEKPASTATKVMPGSHARPCSTAQGKMPSPGTRSCHPPGWWEPEDGRNVDPLVSLPGESGNILHADKPFCRESPRIPPGESFMFYQQVSPSTTPHRQGLLHTL